MFTLLSKVGEGELITFTISWTNTDTWVLNKKRFTSMNLLTSNVLQEPLAMFTWLKWTDYQMNYVLWSTSFLPVVLEGLKMSLNASKILGMCAKCFWILGSWALQCSYCAILNINLSELSLCLPLQWYWQCHWSSVNLKMQW